MKAMERGNMSLHYQVPRRELKDVEVKTYLEIVVIVPSLLGLIRSFASPRNDPREASKDTVTTSGSICIR
jgi:hypothetical protein